MYVLFEYATLLALIVLVDAVLFAAGLVFMVFEQAIGALLRASRKTASAGTREELLITS